MAKYKAKKTKSKNGSMSMKSKCEMMAGGNEGRMKACMRRMKAKDMMM